MSALQPLEPLYEEGQGMPLPLPPEIAAIYGPLYLAAQPGQPTIISNFVSSLDGVVALNTPGEKAGGEISGFHQHDRLVMGLLRALADTVIVGAGTLRAVPKHRWTAARIYPLLAEAYQHLREALNKPEPPLNAIVTASGDIDLSLPVFQSGEVPAVVVTTASGLERLRARLPAKVPLIVAGDAPRLSAQAILDAVQRVRQSALVLVESGPQLTASFFAERRLHELFLTLAPQVAGREAATARPGFVAGKRFAPEDPRWGRLISVKRAGSHLFLRYAFEAIE